MTGIVKKAALGVALGASALVAVAPAEAQYYRGNRHYRHHDRTGVAVAAGVIGLGIGAAIASSNRGRYGGGYYGGGYYDRGYYNGGDYNRGYYDRGYYDGDYNRGYYDSPRYRRCYTQRYYDDWYGRWVRVRRCR